MGSNDMRYFQATPALFDSLRLQIMADYNMPNNFADEPWEASVKAIALNEFECAKYASLIDSGLQAGVIEITKEQYHNLQPVD